MQYTFLLASIEKILGKGHKKARDNYAFHCPKCNHRKQKLEINLQTNDKGENNFACWVCGFRGTTIRSLLKQLRVAPLEAKDILKYLPKGGSAYTLDEDEITLELPKEFQYLHKASTTSVSANIAKRYLHERGLSDIDFIKYSIGYCTNGEYGGRIIVPSYSESGTLNYFIARSYDNGFRKYKNPKNSKDVIFFENHINWNQPIIICEGVFDAIAIRRNSIPILGKTLSKELQKKILTSQVKDIYIALDQDAKKRAVEISQQFISLGKRVFFIDLQDKDPSEMGFKNFTTKIQSAEELDLSSQMMHKLNL